jgi:RimJ/RimL family protein N-acetyltransferase
VADWVPSVAGKGDKIEAKPLNWFALEWIALNLRDRDKQEILGNMPTDNPLEVAAIVMHATAKKGVGWIGWLNSRPVAALGVFEQWPGNWQIWSFGTDDYRRAAPVFNRKFDLAMQYAIDHGCHRMECRSHANHVESHRLLTALGAEREGPLRQYGKDKADYIVFSWVF